MSSSSSSDSSSSESLSSFGSSSSLENIKEELLDNFQATNFGFDESLEPVATEEEWLEYSNAIAVEKQQEEEFIKRFKGEVEVKSW